MRKTGLCGVVIATLFGTAGLLQHPSPHVQKHNQQNNSSLAQAGVNLLNSYSDVGGRQAASSATLLPYGFLRVTEKRGPTPAQLAAYQRVVATATLHFEEKVAAQQAIDARAQAEAAAKSRSSRTSAS